MKQALLRALAVAAVFCPAMTTVVHAQQVQIPAAAAQVPGPALGTAMTKPYVETVGRMAYLWGWPLVNAANRAAAFSKAQPPGLMGGVIPVAYNHLAMLTGYIAPDQHFIACPNQDVAYGAGFFDLDKEAAVVQVRTSATGFGSTPSMMVAPTSSQKSANNTAPNPASI